MNRDKSVVFFSNNCDEPTKQVVRSVLHIDTEALSDRYLGLPTAIGRSTSEAFDFMATRVKGLIGSWSGRQASCVGREVLIKSVAQAVPTYSMSCFLLAKTTCKKLRAAISNYWWGGSVDNRHLHWLRWERLTQHKSVGGLGFRDLHMFNKAMLGKQGWRLLTRPESLCARMLKGRYFHDGDFMGNTRRGHASHTWRAILAGKEVLAKGLIKRIGNGASTEIWNDRWIPLHFDARPLTPADGQVVNLVSDLMSADGHWNEELIRQIFIPVDAEAILRTPTRYGEDDWWAWEFEKHGEYSVKSAYRRLADTQPQGPPEPGNSGDPFWKLIWKLEVPPKVKVFWWRVVHEFLPAKDILHRRHIEPLSHCDVCGADRETIKHTLVDCSIARCFWNEVQSLTGAKLPKLHPVTWATDLLADICSDENRSIFIIGMYSLWTQRNRRRHGEAERPLRAAVQWAIDVAHDLWSLKIVQRQNVPRQLPPSWSPPEEGWLKCNTDGAFYPGKGQGATGAVLRDADGQITGGIAQWYDHGLDALTMEAWALRDGMTFARNKGVQRLHIETDSQELVKLWAAGGNQRSRIAPIIMDARELRTFFSAFKLSYSSRSCNQVAHSLAKQVSGDNRVVEWHVTPPCVFHLISADCNRFVP